MKTLFLSKQPLSDTSSTGSPPAMHRNNKNSAYDLTEIPDFQQPLVRPCKCLKLHVDEC